MRIAYDSIYAHPLPEGHRFPMAKYELLAEQLVYEGTFCESDFFKPQAIDEAWILATHEAAYWTSLREQSIDPRAMRKIGFPWSERLILRSRVIAQATIDCACYALAQNNIGLNIAGGTHHAYANQGEGFCLLNDMAIASNYLLANELAKRILIVDLDVHQGNGTAKIFENEARVFTFSMHGAKNYPFRKEQSSLDLALPDGTNDETYLSLLKAHLPRLIDEFQPDMVFYLSGVDVLATDKLGRLGLSMAGCHERDHYVLSLCKAYGLPVAVSMGGGYSPRLADVVNAHAQTYRIAASLFT